MKHLVPSTDFEEIVEMQDTTDEAAKVIGQLLLNKGDKVKLLFSQEKLCFFNENTNERLKVVAEEELKVVAK